MARSRPVLQVARSIFNVNERPSSQLMHARMWRSSSARAVGHAQQAARTTDQAALRLWLSALSICVMLCDVACASWLGTEITASRTPTHYNTLLLARRYAAGSALRRSRAAAEQHQPRSLKTL